jgi:transposase
MNKESVLSYAAGLSSNERKSLALQCIKKGESIVKIAKDNNVSRKFVYQQKSKAEVAVDNAFLEKGKDDDVLFYIPVTKAWIKQVVLSLVLIGHCSLRGVSEFLMCTMDYSLSHSTVDNIVKECILSVKKIDEYEDFSKIQYGANDEIYQAGMPVLAGVDLVSTIVTF